jgi:hypothetical protein
MTSGGLNPRDEYVDRGSFTVDPVTGPKGTYKTPSLNVGKMAASLLGKVQEQINHAARASVKTEQVLWKEGFGLSDKDFVDGQPNFKNSDVKTRVIGKMTIGFIENKDMQEALLRTNAGFENTFKDNLSAYLASINKGISKAQIDATLKQLALPLINTYTSAFEKANSAYNNIDEEIRNVFQVDPKLVTLEEFLKKMKDSGDTRRREQAVRLFGSRDALRTVIQDAVSLFADDKKQPEVELRVSAAIKRLFDAGYSATVSPQGTSTTTPTPGIPPPPGGATLGINANTQIAPAAFPPMNQGP